MSTALCQHGCKHGDCIGPNKCKCHPGFTGKTCNQEQQNYVNPPIWDSLPPLFVPMDQTALRVPSEGELIRWSLGNSSFHPSAFRPQTHPPPPAWRSAFKRRIVNTRSFPSPIFLKLIPEPEWAWPE
ncbi:nephronectin a isoform X1 [Tachysurus ichikawai]